MRTAALALLALAASPAPAGPVTLPFAPPLDTTLRYRTVQYRTDAGRTQSYTMMLSLRFSRDREGVVLSIVTTAVAVDADPVAARLYKAGMEPFVGVPTRVRLDGDGCPSDVLDLDATWTRIVAALDDEIRAVARRHGNPASLAAMRGYFAAIAASPPAVRKARLLDGARQFLCFARAALAPGETRPWRDDGGSPFGQSATAGTIMLADADAAQAHLVIAGSGDGAAMAAAARAMAGRLNQAVTPAARAALRRQLAVIRATRLSTRRDVHVSRDTGLLLSSSTVASSIGPAGTAILSRETTRRLP